MSLIETLSPSKTDSRSMDRRRSPAVPPPPAATLLRRVDPLLRREDPLLRRVEDDYDDNGRDKSKSGLIKDLEDLEKFC